MRSLSKILINSFKTKSTTRDAIQKDTRQLVKKTDDNVSVSLQDKTQSDTALTIIVKPNHCHTTTVSLEKKLREAVRSKDCKTANALLNEDATLISIKESHLINDTLLICATRNSDYPMMTLLLEKGIDPNIVGEEGMTALMWAFNRRNIKAISLLLKSKADPNQSTLQHESILFERYDLEMLEVLINNSQINVNLRDKLGWTILEKMVILSFFREDDKAQLAQKIFLLTRIGSVCDKNLLLEYITCIWKYANSYFDFLDPLSARLSNREIENINKVPQWQQWKKNLEKDPNFSKFSQIIQIYIRNIRLAVTNLEDCKQLLEKVISHVIEQTKNSFHLDTLKDAEQFLKLSQNDKNIYLMLRGERLIPAQAKIDFTHLGLPAEIQLNIAQKILLLDFTASVNTKNDAFSQVKKPLEEGLSCLQSAINAARALQ